jgi:hypothetical protein
LTFELQPGELFLCLKSRKARLVNSVVELDKQGACLDLLAWLESDRGDDASDLGGHLNALNSRKVPNATKVCTPGKRLGRLGSHGHWTLRLRWQRPGAEIPPGSKGGSADDGYYDSG